MISMPFAYVPKDSGLCDLFSLCKEKFAKQVVYRGIVGPPAHLCV